ncbi:uracil-DNA glycosylase [Frischella sp. Ac48]|uniref:Uracil-DNA glycosylase n=1 Tax=Frischella japonica TaxID=2741544 RepID=A0ABR7R007_9GAMM|nr:MULTISPECIES: uracil-DNA glycosylase [Frischella]MBC9131811.1 uracil-DNA glycosylase [Frischella japonica]MBX4132663.1 uracil-DNA glycosylase [Frischella sp. Ac48]
MTKQLTWHDVIGDEKEKTYFQQIMQFVTNERNSSKIIYPPQKDVFNAFRFTPFSDIKAVILGQDPYHGPNQAHGLSFSVLPGIKPPPSLQNMYKELTNDIIGFQMPNHGYLGYWAEQGVLLLNNVLTVQAGHAHSHAKIGWETFTDHVIDAINEHLSGVVFLLWGSPAQKKGQFIDRQKHHVLTSVHPSPLSAHRGFFGCRHFSKTNEILLQQGKTPIDWQPRLPSESIKSSQ